MNAGPRTWIATLRRSHDNLVRIAGPMTPEEVRAQSYCRDWTNAQVLSHLGSGAEIALMGLPGALGEGPPVSRDAFPAVWDTWNAKSPDDQAADALASDERHVQRLEELSDEELAAARLDFLGMQLDATGIIRLRLGEHVLHTWDLAVMQDPDATVQADAVELLIDNVPQFLAPRLGKPLPEPFRVRITTTEPARDYLLTSAESVRVVNWPGDEAGADGEVPHVEMPAEALLRLSYGRLDAAHTPASVSGDQDLLDKLRAIFPGF
ncbi:MAG TPA: maleylpyruvate isomerase N-terminal domain-containing protein [Streptosporangiaceae bacterium]|nr:maleylpyruvate isomerase N-terminal domain-containing protein [Streptosporangiaceae bacterium]